MFASPLTPGKTITLRLPNVPVNNIVAMFGMCLKPSNYIVLPREVEFEFEPVCTMRKLVKVGSFVLGQFYMAHSLVVYRMK